jgi:transcriptional regulator with XRE-family HTH domain
LSPLRLQCVRLLPNLQELRQKRHLTQQELADRLNLQQAALSKLESQSNMHVRTLQRIVAAMGGELKLVAQFPDEEIIINQFQEHVAA